MPTYQYLCDRCSYSFEQQEKVNEKRKRKCPNCKKLKLHQVYHAPFMMVRSSISGSSGTLGTYAEANDKRIGKYKLTENQAIEQEKIDLRCKKRGAKIPFWRKGREKVNTKLATLDKQQRKAYIEDGKLPPGMDK